MQSILARLDRRAQVAIAVLVALLLVAAALFVAGRSPSTVEVARTSDSYVFEAWKWKLDQAGVHYVATHVGRTFHLSVQARDAAEARVELASSGSIGGVAPAKCPTVSAFATGSGQDEHDSCELKRSVQQQVTSTTGVLEAVVALRQVEGDSALDPANHVTVSVNIYPDPRVHARIDATGMAKAIALTTGDRNLRDITIRVRGHETIWPRPKSRTEGNGSGACGTGPASQPAIDRKNLFETCRARQLQVLVAPMVGGPSHVHVVVNVELTAGERHELRHVVADGVATQVTSSTTTTTAGDAATSAQSSRTVVPSTTDVESTRPSGVVERESVSVVLDGASAQQVDAVRTLLQAAVLPPPRGNVTVTAMALPTVAPEAASAPTTTATDGHPGVTSPTGAAPDVAATRSSTEAATRHRVLVALLQRAVAALLAIALLVGTLLWRRSLLARRRAAAAVERAVLAEQHTFQSNYGSDAAQLAREIELLLGPPAARGAHFVRPPGAPLAAPGSPVVAQATWRPAPDVRTVGRT